MWFIRGGNLILSRQARFEKLLWESDFRRFPAAKKHT